DSTSCASRRPSAPSWRPAWPDSELRDPGFALTAGLPLEPGRPVEDGFRFFGPGEPMPGAPMPGAPGTGATGVGVPGAGANAAAAVGSPSAGGASAVGSLLATTRPGAWVAAKAAAPAAPAAAAPRAPAVPRPPDA